MISFSLSTAEKFDFECDGLVVLMFPADTPVVLQGGITPHTHTVISDLFVLGRKKVKCRNAASIYCFVFFFVHSVINTSAQSRFVFM